MNQWHGFSVVSLWQGEAGLAGGMAGHAPRLIALATSPRQYKFISHVQDKVWRRHIGGLHLLYNSRLTGS
jgi:hypothetical protein